MKAFNKLLLLLCIFFYLYSVQLVGFPFGTRIILALCGLFVLIFTKLKEIDIKKDVFISKYFYWYCLCFAAIIFFSFFAIFINGTNDYEFVRYPLSMIFILLAGYFIHFILKKTYGEVSYEKLMYFIILAVLIQALISLLSFLSPAVSEALLNIQSFSEIDVAKMEETFSFRLNGFGSTFFAAGIINGFALMLIAFLIKSKKNFGSKTYFLALCFLIIFVLGMMMARTTIIGFLLAILYLLFPSYWFNKKIIKQKFKFLLGIIIIPVLGWIIISIASPQTREALETAANFGFEMFINYSEEGEFKSASTDDLATMFIFPSNIKTYLVGDGKYYEVPGNPSNGYYMSTDVGYLRLIYYFGLPGLICYFLFQFIATRTVVAMNPRNSEIKWFSILTFIFLLILNIKGFTDLFFLTTLFCFPFISPRKVAG